uniref:Uncharacterized protein n=1 Tax=Oryza meridionalis TaxID=40149 RepID=A0A0E0E1H3_9ORYZ
MPAPTSFLSLFSSLFRTVALAQACPSLIRGRRHYEHGPSNHQHQSWGRLAVTGTSVVRGAEAPEAAGSNDDIVVAAGMDIAVSQWFCSCCRVLMYDNATLHIRGSYAVTNFLSDSETPSTKAKPCPC